MKRELDIHNYTAKVAAAVKRVEKAGISDRNKELILRFRDASSLDGLGLPRIERYLGVLLLFAEILEKDFDRAERPDIERLVRIIQERMYAPATKLTYKAMLKRFYKWLTGGTDEYPAEVKWIKARLSPTDRRLPADGEMLTQTDVDRLIRAALHPRDRAFVSVLYESGARIGEVGSLQIRNVRFDRHSAILNLTGKTGSRRIRVVQSTPHLLEWLRCHPAREDESAALWVNVGTKCLHSPCGYQAFRNMLIRLFGRAGLKKRFNPHIFRHSRASFLANHLTEYQMNHYFGWAQGSEMPATYVHLSSKQIDPAILRLNGINDLAPEEDGCVHPRICPRCDTINPHDEALCAKCGGPLDATAGLLSE